MIRQCAILFGCLALGELVVWLTGVKLPSSIIGMLLLTLFLKLGWIKLQWVQGMSDFLVANLGFFFVPPGVALMLYFDIIRHHPGRILAHRDGHRGQHAAGAGRDGLGAPAGTKNKHPSLIVNHPVLCLS